MYILLTRSLSKQHAACLLLIFLHDMLLGYDNRFVYCSVVGYTLLLSLIEYKTLVMRGDLERANTVLPSIPKEQHNRCHPVRLFKNFVVWMLI